MLLVLILYHEDLDAEPGVDWMRGLEKYIRKVKRIQQLVHPVFAGITIQVHTSLWRKEAWNSLPNLQFECA